MMFYGVLYDVLCLTSILGFLFVGAYLQSFSSHFFIFRYISRYLISIGRNPDPVVNVGK